MADERKQAVPATPKAGQAPIASGAAQPPPAEQKKEASREATGPARTAADLNAHLAESYSPFATSEKARAWLKENSRATAEEYYRYMEAEGVKLGTLRKAGKWAWGDSFEPETAAQRQPMEEVKLLREQTVTLQTQLARAEAQLAAARRRIKVLEDDFEREREHRLTYPAGQGPGVLTR